MMTNSMADSMKCNSMVEIQISMVYKDLILLLVTGALHTRPWIRIQCGSGIRIQRPLCLHTASIRIRASCWAVLHDSAWDPDQQCHACSLRTAWSWTTLNPNPLNSVSVSVWGAPLWQMLLWHHMVQIPSILSGTISLCKEISRLHVAIKCKGEGHPSQKFGMFLQYLKIINTFFEKWKIMWLLWNKLSAQNYH